LTGEARLQSSKGLEFLDFGGCRSLAVIGRRLLIPTFWLLRSGNDFSDAFSAAKYGHLANGVMRKKTVDRMTCGLGGNGLSVLIRVHPRK
jgi:hypothetical protein